MEIKVVRQILEWNEKCHEEIQEQLNNKRVFMINIMGSPGSGKTSFIIKLFEKLNKNYKIGVIEGDIEGKVDAMKIAELGIPVVQLNTKGACHIEAKSVKEILKYFNLEEIDIILVENIGNLVCPAEFDIGEHLKIALLSIPEGDDKVIKYPLMFVKSNIVVLSKYDMKKYFDFEDDKVITNTISKNGKAKIFKVSSINEFGIDEVCDYLTKYIEKYKKKND